LGWGILEFLSSSSIKWSGIWHLAFSRLPRHHRAHPSVFLDKYSENKNKKIKNNDNFKKIYKFAKNKWIDLAYCNH